VLQRPVESAFVNGCSSFPAKLKIFIDGRVVCDGYAIDLTPVADHHKIIGNMSSPIVQQLATVGD
jgi:hypothetical protein